MPDSTRTAWRCLCGAVYAPHVDKCEVCSKTKAAPLLDAKPEALPISPPFVDPSRFIIMPAIVVPSAPSPGPRGWEITCGNVCGN